MNSMYRRDAMIWFVKQVFVGFFTVTSDLHLMVFLMFSSGYSLDSLYVSVPDKCLVH